MQKKSASNDDFDASELALINAFARRVRDGLEVMESRKAIIERIQAKITKKERKGGLRAARARKANAQFSLDNGNTTEEDEQPAFALAASDPLNTSAGKSKKVKFASDHEVLEKSTDTGGYKR